MLHLWAGSKSGYSIVAKPTTPAIRLNPGRLTGERMRATALCGLRLNMLQEADALSKTGVAELSAIKERRDYLDRAVEDRDFFDSYSSGARGDR